MTFEEFESKLKVIRDYYKKLSRYELRWWDGLITDIFKNIDGSSIQDTSELHRVQRERKKAVKKNSKELARMEKPDEAFELRIRSIINDVIGSNEDLEEPVIIGKSDLRFDTETNKRFKILEDYYFHGYKEEHIGRKYGYSIEEDHIGGVSQVSYQLKVGRKELYQLYIGKEQDK